MEFYEGEQEMWRLRAKMQKRLDWPKEFYEGELKGATKADKMKAQVTKLLKRVK